jgi:hypothetical protein
MIQLAGGLVEAEWFLAAEGVRAAVLVRVTGPPGALGLARER